jgi:hypothetical protein
MHQIAIDVDLISSKNCCRHSKRLNVDERNITEQNITGTVFPFDIM